VPRRRKVRGYPLAVLIGLEEQRASLWNVYSSSIKSEIVIEKESIDYNFFESIINRLRPKVKQGIKTILVASIDEKNYEKFIKHIDKHQHWLIGGYELNRVTLEYVEGSAKDMDSVVELINDSGLQKTIKQASRDDIKRIMGVLEKRLSTSDGVDTILFSIKEVENSVYGEVYNPEYILMTSQFQRQHRRRTQRLLQIAKNKGIKTMIVETTTFMGTRLTQFGGLICLLK
jgi:stalled ribosome rescue protein Dom34